MIGGWLLYFYLPTDGTPLVPVALFSIVVLASRGINIVISLPIDFLSDRTRTRLGRRYPYIFGEVIPIPYRLPTRTQ